VAAATSSVGKDAGDAFSMPGTSDPALELLRGVAILADRDAQRAYLKSIADRAGLELMPVSAWLLLRLGEDSTLTPDAIAREHHIPAARVEEGLAELTARGYAATTAGPRLVALTADGCAAYDRLAAARRERLRALSQDWPEAQRQQVVAILQRLARDLVPSRPA
jgi:DNA-binding MarR family transcriptional regulator